MTGYLLRRLLASLILLLLVLTVTFFLARLAPGDPTDRFANARIPHEQSERLARLYGLDRPLAIQYVAWLRAVAVEWDWGLSFSHLEPVTSVLARSFPATLVLACGAILVQYSLGLALGVMAARRPGGRVDHLVRAASLVFYSVPPFWLGLMLLLLLSHTYPLFPAAHMRSLTAAELAFLPRLLDLLHHAALPAFVLGAPLAAEVARFVRSGLLEVMEQDYIRSARARGLSERRVVWVHGMRNAVVAITQITALDLAFLLGGSFIVESIFAWPGIGYVTLKAIETNDYPLVVASTAFTGTLLVLGNFAADLLHAAADPRVREA